MFPHERSLVKRLEDKPFALLGINSDGDKEFIKKQNEKEQINWRSWWDRSGKPEPISHQWEVTGWPTLYVLDHKGVVRYKGLIGEKLDEAVDMLLKEMDEESKKTQVP